MDKDIDIRLYNEYLNGEKEAFGFLYNKYKDKIHYFIFNIVKDYQKAEDITQEVFIYALQNKVKEGYSFKYYIYLIAKSKAVNYINIEKRRTEISEQYLLNKTNKTEVDVADIIIKEEGKKELIKSIDMLDDKYKNVMYLVKIEELSYKEVAEIIREPVSSVKNLIHRGKKELTKILIKKGFDEMNKFSKVLLSILITIILATGTVFAIVNLYNYFEYKVLDLGEFKEDNGFLYKKIYTYEEYLKYKSQVTDLVEVNKTDFNENFMIIVVSERKKLNGLSLKEYGVEDNILNIKLVNNSQNETIKTSGVSILISKKLDTEKINIEKVSEEMNTVSYKNIKDLPTDYTKEQAIHDNCLIIDQNEKKTYNKEVLLNFSRNIEQQINSEMRIYQIENEKVFIQDIQYIKNSKFIISYDYTRYRTGVLSYETDEIYTNEMKKSNLQSFEQNVELYSIEDNNNQFSFGIY